MIPFKNFSRITEIDIKQVYEIQEELSTVVQLKSKMSLPSDTADDINIPEVSGQKVEFVYNFYSKDERVNYYKDTDSSGNLLPLKRIARYNVISWIPPILSDFEISKQDFDRVVNPRFSIKDNAEKIISEDNFFDPGFINHTFSNIDAIEQGASDLENYTKIARNDAESVFKMSKYQIQEAASSGDSSTSQFGLASLADNYSRLADFPKTSLGLRVFDEKNNLNDEDDLIQSISNAVSLNVKINSCVIPDIFSESPEKNNLDNLDKLKISHESSQTGYKAREGLTVSPVRNDSTTSSTSYLNQPVKIIGYIIEKYLVRPDRFEKQDTFYVEDIQQTTYIDRKVLYGATYIYGIRAVASVKLLTYNPDGVTVDSSTIYVSSRPSSAPIECFEYVPPPEPNDIKFSFDYVKRNLIIMWDMPVNHQNDVKQFQVFRRKTIREPFELIAQYGFDKSIAGNGSSGRYKTGERIDANNFESMRPEDKYLVKIQDPQGTYDAPVFCHVDEDFTVDTEFYISSEYIYAICAVDAHGMISNYSSQHHVTFDSYKNKLVTKVVCDSGSPRQYPNMNLRTDAFKDTIKVSGLESRKLSIHFTPEYLKVRDDRNVTYPIVEAQTPGKDAYYLLQLINLDNQKMQLIKINIQDTKGLTL